jgi:iron complex transport system ATP-binding protein
MSDLETRELTCCYADQVVFQQLTMQMKRGEVLALLGANGAGKTTLLKSLARQLRPSSGVVMLDSKPIATLSRRRLAQQVSLMPQHENREDSLSVYDIVALGRTPYAGWFMPLSERDRTKIDEALKAMDLGHLKDRSVTELSGGEWRRMILARALAQDASILLLDEPTAGLDLRFQHECLNHVRTLTLERKLTTVLTIHDLNQAAMFADRVVLLANKQLLAIGSPEQILTPELIRESFGVEVTVLVHPSRSVPLIVPK